MYTSAYENSFRLVVEYVNLQLFKYYYSSKEYAIIKLTKIKKKRILYNKTKIFILNYYNCLVLNNYNVLENIYENVLNFYYLQILKTV